jgi:predicted nucleic acid-binding protein
MAITAVDSSVVLDVFSGDPEFGAASKAALEAALETGTLVACPVVWAELRAHFSDQKAFAQAAQAAQIHFDPFDQACSELAGDAWRTYRRRGGTRTQLVPDFLVRNPAIVIAGSGIVISDSADRDHAVGAKRR